MVRKNQPTGWDAIFDSYTFNRGLMSRLQRTKKTHKETNTPIENTAMALKEAFSEEVTNDK